MKSFTKTTIETFEPLWVKVDFAKYDESFIRIRSSMRYKCTNCFKCHKAFNINDIVGLAAFKNIGNKVLCQECAKELCNGDVVKL